MVKEFEDYDPFKLHGGHLEYQDQVLLTIKCRRIRWLFCEIN